MSTRMYLALVDPSHYTKEAANAVQQSFRRYGAVRVRAPEISESYRTQVFSNANDFFNKEIRIKENTKGYSCFREECVRHEIEIVKQSIYWYSRTPCGGHIDPPDDFIRSVEGFHEGYTALRDRLMPFLIRSLTENSSVARGVPPQSWNFGNDTIAIHRYDPQQLRADDRDFNPPHVDGNLLTVILQKPGTQNGHLEIADFDSTGEISSEAISKDDSTVFERVPFLAGEVIVLAGKRLQRIFGPNCAPACVHKVSRPISACEKGTEGRLSIAIFCSANK